MQALLAGLFPWLISLVWPLAKKLLLALGIGVLTYSSLSALSSSVISAVSTAWGQQPLVAIQIGSLLGIPQSMGIICGALSARVSFIAVGKLGMLSK